MLKRPKVERFHSHSLSRGRVGDVVFSGGQRQRRLVQLWGDGHRKSISAQCLCCFCLIYKEFGQTPWWCTGRSSCRQETRRVWPEHFYSVGSWSQPSSSGGSTDSQTTGTHRPDRRPPPANETLSASESSAEAWSPASPAWLRQST